MHTGEVKWNCKLLFLLSQLYKMCHKSGPDSSTIKLTGISKGLSSGQKEFFVIKGATKEAKITHGKMSNELKCFTQIKEIRFDVKREILDHTESKNRSRNRGTSSSVCQELQNGYKIFTLHLVDVVDEVVLASIQAVGHEQTLKLASKCCDLFPESYPAQPL